MTMTTDARLTTEKYDLLGRSAGELRDWMTAHGEPGYRGAQVYHALYAERRFAVDAMSNLPAALRVRLAAEARVGLPQVTRRYQSTDGSIRYLLALENSRPATGRSTGEGTGRATAQDKHLPENESQENSLPQKTAHVEAVFMPSDGRQTICISTQAGCAVDCHFCLTAQLGLIRNLTAGEIVGQVLLALDDNKAALAPRTNVVLMGQGEPLLNYDAVMEALRILLDPNGMALAARHVTLSTSGIVPGIERLAREKVRPKLAISLNASSDAQRDQLMPINRKYPLGVLLEACRNYPLRPWEQLTFEYVLLGGCNDAPEDARRVARLVAGLRAKINLIPWNPGELPYRAPDAKRTEDFRAILTEKGFPVFVRQSRGQDISAACGQLALIET